MGLKKNWIYGLALKKYMTLEVLCISYLIILRSLRNKWKCWFNQLMSTNEHRYQLFMLIFHFEGIKCLVLHTVSF